MEKYETIDFDGDDLDSLITFYTDGQGRWLRREWAKQCPKHILLESRCQGVEGHEGDHWCFQPDGSYAWERDKNHPEYQRAACGFTPPQANGYRTPLEMSPHYYIQHFVDSEVTDPVEIARLESDDTRPNESIDRPCTSEEIERYGLKERIDSMDLPSS
jgi:hypothetical protein